MTGHEGGQGGGASPGDLKLSGVMLGAKEKVGGRQGGEPGARGRIVTSWGIRSGRTLYSCIPVPFICV
jgi:hypothetical protein